MFRIGIIGFIIPLSLVLAFAGETPKKVVSVEGITEYKLDNGLMAPKMYIDPKRLVIVRAGDFHTQTPAALQ